MDGQWRKARTRYTDTVNVFRNHTATFNYFVELGTTAMDDDRIQADTIEKTETKSKFVKLAQYSTADFYDSEFCWMRGIGG